MAVMNGVDGLLAWTIDGKQLGLVQGRRCAFLGPPYHFDNLGDQDAKVLCVITPAAIGPQYFRAVTEVMKASCDGPPDKAKLISPRQE